MDEIQKQIHTLQVTVDRHQETIDYDHENITKWISELEALKATVSEFGKTLLRQSKKVIEGVQEAVEEAPNQIANQVLKKANTKSGKMLKTSLFSRIWGRR